MERKEQTGHICRWMALGIMTAIVIVGCTIVIGLFEWRDRKEIECRNAELHQWRKNVHDLNLHITELSLLGEMVADWDSTDVNEYHSLRLEVDSMLQGIADICLQEDSDTICHLLAEKGTAPSGYKGCYAGTECHSRKADRRSSKNCRAE